MNRKVTFQIVPFNSTMQEEFRQLVLEGMAEHWSAVDETLNSDLDDVGSFYKDDVILTALEDGHVIGTAIAVLRPPDAEIVRMSVRHDRRRFGVATQLLATFCQLVQTKGVKRLVLETSIDWPARSFYESAGFRFTHVEDGVFGQDAYYEKEL